MMYSYELKKYVLETDAQPVKIEYQTETGRGVITLNPARVFPCTIHDVKTIIDTLWMSADPYTIGAEIADYIRACVAEIQDHRSHYTGPFDAKIRAQLSGMIKKYLSNLDKIADAFGLDKMSDCEVETMKMKKCEVLCNEVDHTNENGTGRTIKTYSGKTFTKSGIVFQVHQKKKNGARWITLPGTGSAVTSYSGAEKEAPAHIEDRIIDILKSGAENGKLEAVRADFENVCKACGIEPDEMQADIVKHAENTPAPALDAKSETSEARPAADQETRTAEKPARNIIKPGCVRIICTQLRDTKTNKAGDRFEVLKDEYGQWLGDNLRTKKNYAFTESDLCDPELLRIEIQQTADEIKKSLCIIDKPRTAARRDQVPQKPAQVWKPCTMSPLRKYGIIYSAIMGATDRQKPASADRVKAVLRLSKMQGYINLGATDKNPVTGTERSHKAILNLTEYAHGKPPETRQKSALFALGPKCHTADRRKIKQKSPPEFFKQGVEFTQSSHLKMTKNGTRIFQGGCRVPKVLHLKICEKNFSKKFRNRRTGSWQI